MNNKNILIKNNLKRINTILKTIIFLICVSQTKTKKINSIKQLIYKKFLNKINLIKTIYILSNNIISKLDKNYKNKKISKNKLRKIKSKLSKLI